MNNDFLAGAACMGQVVIALFFLRFWQRTRDRLFLFFAASFVVLTVERIVRSAMHEETDWAPYVYLVRLAAFVLIIIAIVDKNRRS